MVWPSSSKIIITAKKNFFNSLTIVLHVCVCAKLLIDIVNNDEKNRKIKFGNGN